ncbi:MAG: NADP(H)-dependent aldo-keto reductase [Cyanobacteria bacterium]|nr:NADP(H)-dependent aldo-keto reductase [Cyanobacteriota bacterium]
MQMNPLGKTEISVSVIGLGTMTWGEQNTEAEAHAQLDLAFSLGVNLIDAAELYPVPARAETTGRTEEYIGTWLKARQNREHVILATKVIGASERLTWIRGGKSCLDKTNIHLAVDASLKRLQTDYIDLYQVHWPDRETNCFGQLGYKHDPNDTSVDILETLSALSELVQAGKIRHIGLSNETPWGVMQYLNLAQPGALPRVVSIQNPYNLLNRTFEVGLAEMAIKEHCGLLAYSPLAFGALSGKYIDGARPPQSRLGIFGDYFGRYMSEPAVQATRQYVDIAKQAGLSPAQMALAFINQQRFLTSNLIGATTLEQLKENIGSAEIVLSADTLKAIEQVHLACSNPCP